MKVKDIRPGGFYLFDASNQWEIPPLDEAEGQVEVLEVGVNRVVIEDGERHVRGDGILVRFHGEDGTVRDEIVPDRKSTRLNSSHVKNSYAVFSLKKKRDKFV